MVFWSLMNMGFFQLCRARSLLLMCAALIALPVSAGSRYVPNAAGDEITDTATGLIWRRCLEGQSWNGSACLNSAATLNWDGGLMQATSLANQTGLPWRVPNVKELASVVDLDRSNPALDTTIFPNTPASFWMWSSTPVAGGMAAWGVEFGHGAVGNSGSEHVGVVRLVRSGQ
jgi:hypothetical protein